MLTRFAYLRRVVVLGIAAVSVGTTLWGAEALAQSSPTGPNSTLSADSADSRVSVTDAVSVEASSEPTRVRVRGSRDAVVFDPEEPTVASTVISGEALRAPGESSASVLARVPGVQVTRRGALSELSTAGIRGASAAHTPVYVAGIRINDEVTGAADLSTVPLWMMDSVRVYRGNAPERADQLGIGGAVFFEPRAPQGSEVGFGVETGSLRRQANWVLGAVGSRRAATLLAFRREGAANDYEYLDDKGTRFVPEDDETVRRINAEYGDHDAWVVTRWEPAAGVRVSLLANGFRRKQGATNLAYDPARNASARTQRLLGGVAVELPCDRRERCFVAATSSWLDSRVLLLDPTNELSLRTPFVHTLGRRASHQLSIRSRPWKSVEWGLGASETVEVVRSERGVLPAQVVAWGGATAGADATRVTGRGTATLRWYPFRILELHSLAALQCYAVDGDSFTSCPEAEDSWRVGGLVRLLPAVHLLGNVGRSVRVPTLGELYGTSPWVQGNTQLGTEVGKSADFGVRAAASGYGAWSPHAYVEAFVFRRGLRNAVSYRRTSFSTIQPFNVEAARVVGFELTARVELLDHVRWTTALTQLAPRDTTPGRRSPNDLLPYTSQHTSSHTLELYSLRGVGPVVSRLSTTLQLLHRSFRYADSAGLVRLEPQTIVDLAACAGLYEDMVLARISIDNLFDVQPSDVIGLPLPGRLAHLALEAIWR